MTIREELVRPAAPRPRRLLVTLPLIGFVALAGLFLARHRVASLFRRSPKATGDADAS